MFQLLCLLCRIFGVAAFVGGPVEEGAVDEEQTQKERRTDGQEANGGRGKREAKIKE